MPSNFNLKRDTSRLLDKYLGDLEYILIPTSGKRLARGMSGWTGSRGDTGKVTPSNWRDHLAWRAYDVDGCGISPWKKAQFIILDVGVKEGRPETFKERDRIEKRITKLGGCILAVETPSGGRHFYLRNPDAVYSNTDGAGPVGNCDWRSHSKYAIAPDNKRYKVIKELSVGVKGGGADYSDLSDLHGRENTTGSSFAQDGVSKKDMKHMRRIHKYVLGLGVSMWELNDRHKKFEGDCPALEGAIKIPKKIRKGVCTRTKSHRKKKMSGRFWVNPRYPGWIKCNRCSDEVNSYMRRKILTDTGAWEHVFPGVKAGKYVDPGKGLREGKDLPCGPGDVGFWEATEWLKEFKGVCLANAVNPINSLLHYLSLLSSISYPITVMVRAHDPMPLNLYVLTSGSSGEGKSTTDVRSRSMLIFPDNPRKRIPEGKFDVTEKDIYRTMLHNKVTPHSKQGLFDKFLVHGAPIDKLAIGKTRQGKRDLYFFPGAIPFLVSDEEFGNNIETWAKDREGVIGLMNTAFFSGELILSTSLRNPALYKRPPVSMHEYSFGVSVRGTPSTMVQVLRSTGGLAQRFVFCTSRAAEWRDHYPSDKERHSVRVMPAITAPDLWELSGKLDKYESTMKLEGKKSTTKVYTVIPCTDKVKRECAELQDSIDRQREAAEVAYEKDPNDKTKAQQDKIGIMGHRAATQAKIAALLALHDEKPRVRMVHWRAASSLLERNDLSYKRIKRMAFSEERFNLKSQGRKSATRKNAEEAAMYQERIADMAVEERLQLLKESALDSARIWYTNRSKKYGEWRVNRPSDLSDAYQDGKHTTHKKRFNLTDDDITRKEVQNILWDDFQKNSRSWTVADVTDQLTN